MFSVTSNRNNNILAVIIYGWETPDFYISWLKDNNQISLADIIGPTPNPNKLDKF
jgi:hypothetical protein